MAKELELLKEDDVGTKAKNCELETENQALEGALRELREQCKPCSLFVLVSTVSGHCGPLLLNTAGHQCIIADWRNKHLIAVFGFIKQCCIHFKFASVL